MITAALATVPGTSVSTPSSVSVTTAMPAVSQSAGCASSSASGTSVADDAVPSVGSGELKHAITGEAVRTASRAEAMASQLKGVIAAASAQDGTDSKTTQDGTDSKTTQDVTALRGDASRGSPPVDENLMECLDDESSHDSQPDIAFTHTPTTHTHTTHTPTTHTPTTHTHTPTTHTTHTHTSQPLQQPNPERAPLNLAVPTAGARKEAARSGLCTAGVWDQTHLPSISGAFHHGHRRRERQARRLTAVSSKLDQLSKAIPGQGPSSPSTSGTGTSTRSETPALQDTTQSYLQDCSPQRKQNRDLSLDLSYGGEDRPEPALEDLPTLSPAKRKRQSTSDRDRHSILGRSLSSPSDGSSCGASAAAAKYCGKQSSLDSVHSPVVSTSTPGCSGVSALTASSSQGVKYLGKGSLYSKLPKCSASDTLSSASSSSSGLGYQGKTSAVSQPLATATTSRPCTVATPSHEEEQPEFHTDNSVFTINTYAPTYLPLTTATTGRPLTSATTNQPLTSATTSRPLTATTTSRPLTSATTSRPLTSATTSQPLTSAMTRRPLTSATTSRPLTSATTSQPLTSAMTSRHLTLTTSSQPSTSATTSRPLAKATTSQPLTCATISQPLTEATTSRPLTSATTSQPLTSATISQPLTSATISQPLTCATTIRPVAKATTSRPCATATVGVPVPDGRTDKQRLDRLRARILGLLEDADKIHRADPAAGPHGGVTPPCRLASGPATATSQALARHQTVAPLSSVPASSQPVEACSQGGAVSGPSSTGAGAGRLEAGETGVTTATAGREHGGVLVDLLQRPVGAGSDRPATTAPPVPVWDVVASTPPPPQPADLVAYRYQARPPLASSSLSLLAEVAFTVTPIHHAAPPGVSATSAAPSKCVLQPARLFAASTPHPAPKPLIHPPRLILGSAAVPGPVSGVQVGWPLVQNPVAQPGPWQGAGARQAMYPQAVQGDPTRPIMLDDSQEERMLMAEEVVIEYDGTTPADLQQEKQPPPPPPPPAAPHPGLDFAIQTVLEVVPQVEAARVRDLLNTYLREKHTLDHALDLTMDRLLQEMPVPTPALPDTPTREVTVVHVQEPAGCSQPSRDYFRDYTQLPSYPRNLAADRLSMEFRCVRMETITSVLQQYNFHYAPAYRCLKEGLDALVDQQQPPADSKKRFKKGKDRTVTLKFSEGDSKHSTISVSLMKGLRLFNQRKMDVTEPGLCAEIDFVSQRLKQHTEEVDRLMAWALLESDYSEAGQAIECGCCFTQQPFENLVQCFEGHLFCCQCLLGYAREAVFGAGKLSLICMTADCESRFPKNQLVKALPGDVLQKYEERMTEEDLSKAALEDLVRCPACNIAVVLDAHVQLFQCPNSTCRKESCRKCKEDWAEHRGKTCEQIEKNSETKLRTSYEEKMTAARVRTCHECQAQFFKEEGCNKMTCRCGATMCYICRTPRITYKHFCQHPREPGHDCNKCKSCFLWSNPETQRHKDTAAFCGVTLR
ncbi:hypothetical protein ACOMHN_058393 [Nucella lapillus]